MSSSLSGAYKFHTRYGILRTLSVWCFEVDRVFVARLEALFNNEKGDMIDGLNCSAEQLDSWMSLKMPLDERTAFDQVVLDYESYVIIIITH